MSSAEPFSIFSDSKATASMDKESKETRFVIVGDGPLRSHLISYSKEQGVSDKFVFLGDVPEAMLPIIQLC